jgi:hypothetical protein
MDLQRKACLAIILALGMKRHVKRRCWMKEWLKKRDKYSHVILLEEISATEVDDYKNYFRMNKETFNKLRQMIEPFLSRKDTVMRSSLPLTGCSQLWRNFRKWNTHEVGWYTSFVPLPDLFDVTIFLNSFR